MMTIKLTTIDNWILLMQNNVALKQSDLVSPTSFEAWIRENLGHLYLRVKIPEEHLLIYLNYIKEMVLQHYEKDRSAWADLIRDLENKLQAIDRNKERNNQ